MQMSKHVEDELNDLVMGYLSKSDEQITKEIVALHDEGDQRFVDFLIQVLLTRRQISGRGNSALCS